jgi:hypothetical protein
VNEERVRERKKKYQEQIALIADETRRNAARYRGECKLVQEFGNASEKDGIKFGLVPSWAHLGPT